MPIQKQRNFATTAIISIVIIMITLAVISGITLYSSVYNESINAMRQQNQALVNRLEGWLTVKEALIENNAMLMRDPNIDVSAVTSYFSEQVERIDDIDLAFAGLPDGRMILSTGLETTGEVFGPKRPWYIEAAQNPGQVIFTRPYMGAATRRLVFAAARTVDNDNANLGVVAVSIPLAAVTNHIAPDDSISVSTSFIIDSHGYILFHPDPAFAPIDDFMFQNIHQAGNGMGIHMLDTIINDGLYTCDGLIHIGAPLAYTGWYVITRIPTSYIVVNILPTLFSIIVTVIFALTILTGAWIMLRKFRSTIDSEREAHRLSELFLNEASLAIELRDENYNLIDCNAQTLKMFGVSNKEEYIKWSAELLPEFQPCGTLSSQKIIKLMKEALKTGKANFEFMCRTANGEPLPLEITFMRTVFNGQTVIACYATDLRPIIAALDKEIESLKRMSEADELAMLMLEATPLSCFITKRNIAKDGTIKFEVIDCNRAALNLFGFSTKEEALARFYDLFPKPAEAAPPLHYPVPDTMFNNATIAYEQGFNRFEYTYRCLNGELIPCEVTLVCMDYKGEQVIVGYQDDLRQIRAVMEKEYQAYTWTRMFFDTSPIACFLLDVDLKAIDCNLAALNLFVRKPGEPIIKTYPEQEQLRQCQYGTTCDQHEYCGHNDCKVRSFLLLNQRQTFPDYDQNKEAVEDIVELYCKEAAKAGIKTFEYTVITLYGQLIPCEVIIVPVNFRDISGFSVYYRDLRDEKLREAAEQENRAKTRFLARMSHEIRTPMNAVIGATEIQLQKGGHHPDTEEAFLLIYNSSRLLLNLINDILDLSKVEAGKMEIIPAAYEVTGLIADTVQLSLMYIGSKNIEFSLDVNEKLPSRLIGDELRIKQILNNFISNSFKYTQEGEVTLEFGMEENPRPDTVTLFMKVTDTGQGMTMDQISNLFAEEFTRYNLEYNRTIEGSGLGMTIAHSLIKLMEGDIDVESKLGVGSAFIIRIPQKTDGNQVLGKETVKSLRDFKTTRIHVKWEALQAPEPMPYGRVLVVDDVDTNLYVIKGLLFPYRLVVETAYSGLEAIDLINEGKVYDIIFMDHMMPEMDGIAATNILRNMNYDGPVIALTANATVGIAEMFMNNGFSGFIPKPINPGVLDEHLMKFIYDKQPPEVIEAARAQYSDRKEDWLKDLSHKMVESFLLDAKKSMSVFEPAMYKNEIDSGTCKILAIQFHAIKSALLNIGRPELSKIAAFLELAAQNNDFKIIKDRLSPFVKSLREIIFELSAKIFLPLKDEDAADFPKSDKDLAGLRKQLLAISAACEAYDKRTVKSLIDDLKQSHASAHIRALLSEIDSKLLLSDFEEAAILAKRAADTNILSKASDD